MKRFFLLLLAVLLILWARSALYAVDYAEFAYVTRFGEPVATHDGSAAAGLHVKCPWPIDSVIRVDRRLQSFDLPATEALTRDPQSAAVDKTLSVDAYLTWRVPDSAAADRFVRSVGSADQVRRVLTPRISGRLASAVSSLTLDDLISVADEPRAAERAGKLQAMLFSDELRQTVLEDYGVEILSLRIRRLSYPEAVRASIYERIRSERGRKVAEYENQGRREATEILSNADKERRRIEAEARAAKQLLEGKAEVEADRIRNEAHAQDPEFYAFLQKLKALQTSLSDTRDVLLLSLNHELFKLLREPPPAGGGK